MIRSLSRSSVLVALVLCVALPARAATQSVAKDPYLGAIVVDASSGKVLAEDHADAVGYPASVLKLMDLLIILEKVEQGALRLDDRVTVTAEAAKIGGSQVYLAEKEVFTIDELLYALMIQSANDAATALAIHVAGSKDAFVQMMNQRAQALGMTHTHFESVHGLPPGAGQSPDITTARDLATLCVELCKHPRVFEYTGTQVRGFRNNTFEMRNHNHLLGSVDGVDGFKTGYFRAAGYSIAATAKREGVRVIAVVLGSASRLARDAKATELLAKGFLAVPRAQPAVAAASPSVATQAIAAAGTAEEDGSGDEPPAQPPAQTAGGGWWKLILGIVIGAAVALGGLMLLNRRPRDDKADLLRR